VSSNEVSVRYRDLPLGEFVARLASPEPVPGGGSASATAAALGAALVAMVAALSRDRPKYAEHDDLLTWAEATGQQLTDRFLGLADEDAEAYAAFAAAMKLPRATEAETATRSEAMASAGRRAAEVPLACIEACLDLASAAEALAGRSNVNASSDLNVASLLVDAAANGAAANVLVNLSAIGDPAYEGELIARVEELVYAVQSLGATTREVVGSGRRRAPIAAPSAG
jgi:formiminotetrahydrofolate cyclodeaminase